MTVTLGGLITRAKMTRRVWIASLALMAMLLLFPLVVRLDGRQHADWQQFLGRFHPLAVHLPIGLIALIPLLEMVGTRRPALRETAGFVLALACATCVASVALGYLLAYGSGDTGSTLSRHLWGGVALTIGLLLCILSRPQWSEGGAPRLYPSLLACVLLALVWTAHQGGSLTHGSNYLTQFMPAPLKRIATLTAADAAATNPNSFYSQRIHPLLDSHCVSCHGVEKMQGGLRLDIYQGLLRGGKSGPAVVPRDQAKSLLLTRITLPVTDKHFMPAEGRPALRPEEIVWLRAWIEKGASPSSPAIGGVNISEPPAESPLQPVSDYSGLMDGIHRMQLSQGAKLIAVSSKASDGLILNTLGASGNFDDAALSNMLKFAPYIVEADLARTAVTDASFDTLSHFTQLRALHLEGTAVDGNGLAKLAGLTQLNYLNLSGTKMTSSAVGQLKAIPNLRHVYLFDTPAQPSITSDTIQISDGSTK